MSNAHIEAYTHKHKFIVNTQHKWQQPCSGDWLGGTEDGVFVRDNSQALSHTHTYTHTHTHTHKMTFKFPKKKLENRGSGKATRLFHMT